ncbi:hypothetical protein GF415_04715, partial [Candidatus Micrarchaeota archaeon]|nr:hypothetical protein [Candidatus Micrarchaeota archaeon]
MRGHSKVWSIIIPIIFLLSLAGNFFEGPASTLLGFAPSEMEGSGWSVVDIETLVSSENASQNQTANTTNYPVENNSGLIPIEEAINTSAGGSQENNSGLIPIEEIVDSENVTSAGPSAPGPEGEPQRSSKSTCERMGYKSAYCVDKEEKVRIAGYMNEELSLGRIYLNKTKVMHDNESSRTTVIHTHAVLQNLTNVEIKDAVFEGTGGSVEFRKLRLDIGSKEVDLSSVLKIRQNHIGVDSEEYPQFDQPAHLVFTNLYGLTSPIPLRNGEPCPDEVCSNLTYNGGAGTAEFDVSGFSNYSVGEINITYAEHLDSNYTFISDITDEVYYLDGNWSEPINSSHYVRATFERNLTNGRIIDAYLRSTGGATFDVYIAGTDTWVGSPGMFNPAGDAIYINVKNLPGPTDTFDFKVSGGPDAYLEFDFIHDVAGLENISLVASPSGQNLDSDNLTVSYDLKNDFDNATVNWYLDYEPLVLLNLPFSGDTSSSTAEDFSSFGNDLTTYNQENNSYQKTAS